MLVGRICEYTHLFDSLVFSITLFQQRRRLISFLSLFFLSLSSAAVETCNNDTFTSSSRVSGVAPYSSTVTAYGDRLETSLRGHKHHHHHHHHSYHPPSALQSSDHNLSPDETSKPNADANTSATSIAQQNTNTSASASGAATPILAASSNVAISAALASRPKTTLIKLKQQSTSASTNDPVAQKQPGIVPSSQSKTPLQARGPLLLVLLLLVPIASTYPQLQRHLAPF